MAHYEGKVYIGTILLERNRWAPGRQPTYRVSEWVDRFREAGFDGMELWENHAALCPPEELAALEHSPLPIAVFNSYCSFDDGGKADRERAIRLANQLRAGGVKFNMGPHPTLRDAYVENVLAWRAGFAAETRILCECHPGTILEEPESAAAAFADLGTDRFQAIVHPFFVPDRLREWFRHLGPAITHTHIQMRDGNGLLQRLSSDPARVKETLRILREEGFRGSFTLEFTEGVSTPDEEIKRLFQAACDDLQFLREHLSQ